MKSIELKQSIGLKQAVSSVKAILDNQKPLYYTNTATNIMLLSSKPLNYY